MFDSIAVFATQSSAPIKTHRRKPTKPWDDKTLGLTVLQRICLRQLVESVLKVTGESYDTLFSPCRKKKTIIVRQIIAHTLRHHKRFGFSYKLIGRIIGRDHTSVISIEKKAEYIFRQYDWHLKQEDQYSTHSGGKWRYYNNWSVILCKQHQRTMRSLKRKEVGLWS